jgi:hypothetical protein
MLSPSRRPERKSIPLSGSDAIIRPAFARLTGIEPSKHSLHRRGHIRMVTPKRAAKILARNKGNGKPNVESHWLRHIWTRGFM